MHPKLANIVVLWLLFSATLFVQIKAQDVVDKTVAVVSDGRRSELITYSDLLWQLALQNNAPPVDKPRSEDLNQALRILIDQRLFALEAQRLPSVPSDKDIADEIASLLERFTPTAFQARLRAVGFESIGDEAFRALISKRLAIKKYVDFRFASFVVITSEDEARYYRDVYVPEFRRLTPGLVLPTLEESRAYIRKVLTEQKIGASIEIFLEEAKRRVSVEILSEV
jgi:hypothetical protein